MPNRLNLEKSPYLLQHAHNPVDWYPWGADAFEKARSEDKPIFLSVGYSTCHWCHVMERESFEDPKVAEILNQHFVPIKVDREERPDVDRVYMTYVQATTQSGGWPMSVFLTPELTPFFGGTYFPRNSEHGRPGFRGLLQSIARGWDLEREKIRFSVSGVAEQLRQMVEPGIADGAVGESSLDSAFLYFRRTFDSSRGGFGAAPKFPRPSIFHFLLRYYARTHNDEALEMTLQTLRAMARGGMRDQLGGGFHRYSVDERWFVPHFEKMLYDQAQLAVSYLEAYQITRDEFFAGIARSTLDYVLRDLRDPLGGFHSAEDADSALDPADPLKKGEGAFYIWSRQEIDRVLPHPDAAVFCDYYGVEADGNVYHDPHGEFTGKNILYVRRTLEQTAERFETTPELVAAGLEQSRKLLLAARDRHPRPHRDDKVIAAWNGLMISAFAKGAQALGEPRYAEAAAQAATFLLTKMRRENGGLLRRYRDGEAAIPAFLDDYAFFVQGLLDLYETEFRVESLDAAIGLTLKMIADFKDRKDGGFFATAEGDDALPLRMKDDNDGAEPSGNSVALMNLLRLARMTGRPDFETEAGDALRGMSSRIVNHPYGVPQMLSAVMLHLSPKRQVVIAGPAESQETHALLRELHAHFLPGVSTFLIGGEETAKQLARFSPLAALMTSKDGRTLAYVCQDFACQLPVSDLAKFSELLQ